MAFSCENSPHISQILSFTSKKHAYLAVFDSKFSSQKPKTGYHFLGHPVYPLIKCFLDDCFFMVYQMPIIAVTGEFDPTHFAQVKSTLNPHSDGIKQMLQSLTLIWTGSENLGSGPWK